MSLIPTTLHTAAVRTPAAPAAGVGIDPATLSPSLLLDKDRGITVATGVSNWADQSGNSRDLAQATGSLQPVNSADGPQGDGTDDFLQSAVACSTMITTAAYTAIVVFKPTSSSTNSTQFFLNDGLIGEHSNARWGVGIRSTPELQVGHLDSGGTKQVALSISFGTTYILSWYFDGSTIRARLNDDVYSTVSAVAVTGLSNFLNYGITAAGYGDAAVSDVALWPTARTTDEIDGVRDFYNALRSVY